MSDDSGDIKGSKTGFGIPSWFLELSGHEEPKVATEGLGKGAPSSEYQKEQQPRSSADGFLHSGLWKCDSAATEDGVFPNQQLVMDAWDNLPWGIRSSPLGKKTEEKLQSSITTGDEKLFEEAKREVELLLFYYDYEVNVRQAAQQAVLEHFPIGFPADKINFEFFINIPDGLYDYEALSKSALVREFRALPSEKRAALSAILFALKSPGFTDGNLLENPLLSDGIPNTHAKYDELNRWVEQRREYFKNADLDGFLEKVKKAEERETQKDLLLNDSARERLELGSAIQQLAILKKLEGVGAEDISHEEAVQTKAFLASALIAHDNYLKGQESAKAEIEAAVTSPAQDFASIFVSEAHAETAYPSSDPDFYSSSERSESRSLENLVFSIYLERSRETSSKTKFPQTDRAIVRAALEKLAKDEELDPSILELAISFTKAEVKARLLGLALQAGSAEVGGKLIDPVSEAESLDLNGDGSKVQKILDDIDITSLANGIDDSVKAVIEQEKLVASMVGKEDIDKGYLNKRYQTLRENYTAARRLLDEGDKEEARSRFLTLSNSPFAQSVNKEFSESLERSESIKFGARIGIIVAAGVASSLTAVVAAPWLATTFKSLSVGELAAANLFISSAAFMGAEKILSYSVLNELPYNPDAGALENAGLLTIEYLETVGMFKFLGMGHKAYAQLVERALFRRAEMQLVKEGAIKWGEKYTSEAARALLLQRAELGIAGKILNAGGAFGAEYISFSAWDLILATGHYIAGDDLIDPTQVMSPEALKERFIFLFCLKLAGVAAMPITKPLHEKTAKIMLAKYKPQLWELAEEQEVVLKRLSEYKNSGREDIGELKAIFSELKTLAKKRERLQMALVQSGMATVDQLAFTRSARKDAETFEPKLKLLKDLARLVTPKKANEWEYKPENRDDVRELIKKLITDHNAEMTEENGVYKIRLSPDETLEIRPKGSQGEAPFVKDKGKPDPEVTGIRPEAALDIRPEGNQVGVYRPSVVIATAVDKKGAIHTMLGQFKGDPHTEYGVFLTKDGRYLVVRGDETSIREPESEEGFFVGHTHPNSRVLPSFVDMRSSVYGREQIFALSEDGTTIISSSFVRVGDRVFAYRGPDGGVAGRKPVSEFIFYAMDGVRAEDNTVMAEFVRVPQRVIKQLIESGASEATVDVPTYASTVHDDRTVTETKGRMNRLRIGVERGPDGKVKRIGIRREWQDNLYHVITPEILDAIDPKATRGDAGWQQDWAGTPPVTVRIGDQHHSWPADKYFFTIGSDARSDIQVTSEPKLGGQQIKIERGDHREGDYSISNDQNSVSVIGLEQLDNGGAVIRKVRLGPGVKDGDVHLCLRPGEHWRVRVGETDIYMDIPGLESTPKVPVSEAPVKPSQVGKLTLGIEDAKSQKVKPDPKGAGTAVPKPIESKWSVLRIGRGPWDVGIGDYEQVEVPMSSYPPAISKRMGEIIKLSGDGGDDSIEFGFFAVVLKDGSIVTTEPITSNSNGIIRTRDLNNSFALLYSRTNLEEIERIQFYHTHPRGLCGRTVAPGDVNAMIGIQEDWREIADIPFDIHALPYELSVEGRIEWAAEAGPPTVYTFDPILLRVTLPGSEIKTPTVESRPDKEVLTEQPAITELPKSDPSASPAADTKSPSLDGKRTYIASLTLNTSNVQAMWDGSVSRISVDGAPVAHIAKVMNTPLGFRLVPEEGVTSIRVVGRDGEEYVTGPFELCDGDIIRIGGASITFVVTDTAALSNIKFQTLPPPVEVPVPPRVSAAVDVPRNGVVGVNFERGISPVPVFIFESEADGSRNELSFHDTSEGTIVRHYDETTAIRIENRDTGITSGINGRGDGILGPGSYTISIYDRWSVPFVDGEMMVPEGVFPLASFKIGIPRPAARQQLVPAKTMGAGALGMQRIEAALAKRAAAPEEIQWVVSPPDVNDPVMAGELVSAVGRLLEPFIERHEAAQTRAYVNKTPENWTAYEEAEKDCRNAYLGSARRYKAAFKKISDLAKTDATYRDALPPYALEKISVILKKANERGDVENPELYQDVMVLAKKVDEAYSSACKKNIEAGRGIGGMPHPRAFEGIEDRAERERAYREAMAPFIEAYETDILKLREEQNARLQKAGVGETAHDRLFEKRNGVSWTKAERLARRFLDATEETNREFVDMVAKAIGTKPSDVRPWDVEYAVRKIVQDEVGGTEPTMKLNDAILVAQRFYKDKFGIDIFDPSLGVVFELEASKDHYRSAGLSFSAVNGAKVVLAELNPERITLSDLRTILHEVGHLIHNVLAEENLTQKGEGYLLTSNHLYKVAEAFARATADAVFDESWAEAYLPGQFSAQYVRAYAMITQRYEVYKTRRSYVLASASRIMSDPVYPTIEEKRVAIAKLQRDVLGINDSDGNFAFGVYHLASELYDTYFLNYVMADAIMVEIGSRAEREGSDPFKLFEPLLREGGALTEERLQAAINNTDAGPPARVPEAPAQGVEAFIPKLPQVRSFQEVPHEVHVFTLNDGSSVRRSSGDMVDAGMGVFFEPTEDGGLKHLKDEDGTRAEFTVVRNGKKIEPPLSGDLIVYPGDVLEIGRSGSYRVTVGRETFRSDTFSPAASGDAWDHNIRMVYSRNFSDIRRSESMGGNAGSNHVAINGVYDPATGRIIFFDNQQYLPPQIRGLPEISIHYNVSSRTITNVTVGDVGGPAITETLKRLKGLDRSIPMEWHLSGRTVAVDAGTRSLADRIINAAFKAIVDKGPPMGIVPPWFSDIFGLIDEQVRKSEAKRAPSGGRAAGVRGGTPSRPGQSDSTRRKSAGARSATTVILDDFAKLFKISGLMAYEGRKEMLYYETSEFRDMATALAIRLKTEQASGRAGQKDIDDVCLALMNIGLIPEQFGLEPSDEARREREASEAAARKRIDERLKAHLKARDVAAGPLKAGEAKRLLGLLRRWIGEPRPEDYVASPRTLKDVSDSISKNIENDEPFYAEGKAALPQLRYDDVVMDPVATELMAAEIKDDLEVAYQAEMGKMSGFEEADRWYKWRGGFSRNVHGRIYFNVNMPGASQFVRYLLDEVLRPNRRAIAGFKIALDFKGVHERADSAVLYFDSAYEQVILDEVLRFVRRHPEFTKDATPEFAAPLADGDGQPVPGVSFGEEPFEVEGSFNSVRKNALNDALAEARKMIKTGGRLKWQAVAMLIKKSLLRYRIDPDMPVFNVGGSENFKYIAKHIYERPVEASGIIKPIPTTPPDNIELIFNGEAFRWSRRRSELVIGRGEGADIKVLAQNVSREHAILRRRADGIYELEHKGQNPMEVKIWQGHLFILRTLTRTSGTMELEPGSKYKLEISDTEHVEINLPK